MGRASVMLGLEKYLLTLFLKREGLTLNTLRHMVQEDFPDRLMPYGR